MRGRAEVARRAHNPEVVGSNPAPATNKERPDRPLLLLFFLEQPPLLSIISTPPKTIMNDKKLSFINNFF